MVPNIQTLSPKIIVGKSMRMSLVQNLTRELWQSFMPERNKIGSQLGTDLYSIQLYEPAYFQDFNPSNEFTKWAGVEVSDANACANGMEVLTIPAGLYAVFRHRGGPATAAQTFQYIFTQWLPNSGYRLDHRPHFEVLGAQYKNSEPDSEEDVFIPIVAI